jgi:hypothetical protein
VQPPARRVGFVEGRAHAVQQIDIVVFWRPIARQARLERLSELARIREFGVDQLHGRGEDQNART